MRSPLFLDTEFTGLHQHSTLISLALVNDAGDSFYAEFSDYARDQCDDWIVENVLRRTRWLNDLAPAHQHGSTAPATPAASGGDAGASRDAYPRRSVGTMNQPEGTAARRDEGDARQRWLLGDHQWIRPRLQEWLTAQGEVEVWADCHPWDWVLFCQIFGGAFGIPANLFYMPMDLATLFRARGLDPDADRQAFARLTPQADEARHNALWDAEVTAACYRRLIALSSSA